MSDNTDDVGLASGRSRRSRRENTGRSAALELIRSGKKNKVEVEDDAARLYDMVDEKEYSRRVQERLEDDWIVDDGCGDGYVEDGREIFDDDIVDDGQPRSHSDTATSSKRKARVRDPALPKKGNLRDMLLNMPSKKTKRDVKLEEDEDLQGILQDIKASPVITAKGPQLKRKALPTTAIAKKPLTQSSGRTPPAKKPPSGLTALRPPLSVKSDHNQTVENRDWEPASQRIDYDESQDSNKDSERAALDALIEDDDSMFESIGDSAVEVDTTTPTVTAAAQKNISVVLPVQEVIKTEPEVKETATEITSDWMRTASLCVEPSKLADVVVDASSLPLTTNADGQQVLRMFWLDAYCDNAATSAHVYLFGRVWVPSAAAHVSCCVRFSNIPRRVFLLPRQKRLQKGVAGDDVTMKDVYEEFNSKIANRFKIQEFRSKVSTKNYAFEKFDVPNQADYLEVMYSSQYPALPSNLEGETFSHVFGTNTNTLETFIIGNKLKGPCWIDIKKPAVPQQKLSFCAVEASASLPQPGLVSAITAPPPPITVVALAARTVVNPHSHLNELVMISCLVHSQFKLDGPAPSPLFQQHFCALTKPADAAWPFDLDKQLAGFKSTTVRKCMNEKALISFFLAKLSKLNPDLVVGHNMYGFDLEVLLSRCRLLKINSWPHLGRLRRSADVLFKSRQFDDFVRGAMCGRLLLDTFLSAKELTRQKSYDLPQLCRTVLHVPETELVDVAQEKMAGQFCSSGDILRLITLTMQQAHFSLRVMVELNALPLALQITCLAGNLMSRTLLGGRAERNEYLLLHAFTEKDYIVPDKRWKKRKYQQHHTADTSLHGADDEDQDTTGATTDNKGRKKPKYGGGLVLEPKRGFYDRYILLMDFNSLYPSIIQEYNICFTTLPRVAAKAAEEDEDAPLELPSDELELGILPMEIRKLVERRRAVKQLMKDPKTSPEEQLQLDVRQKALKLTANSMYGCLGFESSRFYAKHLAALITAKGRDILLQTKSLVERMDLEVVYGDTDSIMINSRQLNFDQVMELGREIKREVNKLYKLLELDVDGLYRYMLLLKKKKYAAVAASRAADGVIHYQRELKGLDIVRRDWSKLSADCGMYIIDQIFSPLGHDEKLEQIHSHLETVRARLEAKEVPLADLAITKELKKNPEEYPDKKGQAHVNVALRQNSRGGKKLRRGHTVQYIICKDNSGLDAMQRAYSLEEVEASGGALTPDVDYYLASQIHPVASRLVEPIEGTDAARLAEALGMDASKFRQQASRPSASEPPSGSVDTSLVQRFDACQPLTVHCVSCQQPQQFTDVFLEQPGNAGDAAGASGARMLRLVRCETSGCQAEPKEYLPLIINKLRLEIRHVTQQYLQGVLECEDATCGHETRRLPFLFQRGLPVCNVCRKAAHLRPKYDEQSLYNQLSYYQHMFDLHAALERRTPAERVEVRRRNDFSKLEEAYRTLAAEAQAALRLSSYSHVDLGVLFRDMMIRPHSKRDA